MNPRIKAIYRLMLVFNNPTYEFFETAARKEDNIKKAKLLATTLKIKEKQTE